MELPFNTTALSIEENPLLRIYGDRTYSNNETEILKSYLHYATVEINIMCSVSEL